jgi:hypothetical protein
LYSFYLRSEYNVAGFNLYEKNKYTSSVFPTWSLFIKINMIGVDKTFCCIPCGYFCNRKSNLKKHHDSKRHIEKVQNTAIVEGRGENVDAIQNTEAIVKEGYKCKKCLKSYKSYQGLWGHNKKCEVVAVVPHETEIVNFKGMIVELSKKPTSITNNYNLFLNDKCHNACDIKRFIAGIDFSKENYHNILEDYVGGNAEIITKSYNNLPENERPVYVFKGEDEHQKVAHILYDNKWVVERELGWEKQVRREYNDGVNDDPEPNSMYSLIRLFDKKKMEYFDNNYRQSHLYLSQRKFNKDCLDDEKQLELINTIVDMVSITPK